MIKLTKYEHACFVLENESGQKIIVDPGAFTKLPENLSNITSVIITHDHGDHFAPENIDKIRQQNPEVKIYGSKEVAAAYNGVIVPEKNQAVDVPGFKLEFYGDIHEFIREGVPQPDNLGVIINDSVAYPGDSYSQTDRPVKLLLAPASAPWLRAKEAYEFIVSAPASVVIPTHDALLSEAGMAIYDNHFSAAATQSGKEYKRLNISETIEV